jgi:thiamine-monophosphate kinase
VKNKAKTNENSLIERIRRTANRPSRGLANDAALPVAIGDDAAIWRPRAGYEILLTCDWFLEDSHFLTERHPADSIGWKCLARAASDIAAMGGLPRYFLLSLALPPSKTGPWMGKFLGGLARASRALQCPIAGGDTTRQEQILINITIVGECRRGFAVLRSGARPGDAIFVTGRLGEAQYGLELLRSKKTVTLQDARLRKHLYPEPRLAIGAWLAQRSLATAMMDLSDGLSSDLPRLCARSGCGARIEAGHLPCVRIGNRDKHKWNPPQLALHGGDDYELLFTVAQRNLAVIPKAIGRVALTPIGAITAQREITLVRAGGRQEELLPNRGWDPFRS